MDDDRTKWLAGLKVGDEVALRRDSYSGGHYEFHRVTKITPTRRFRIDGVDGLLDGLTFEPVTAEVLEVNRRRRAFVAVDGFRGWTKLTTAELEAVAAIVGRYREGGR